MTQAISADEEGVHPGSELVTTATTGEQPVFDEAGGEEFGAGMWPKDCQKRRNRTNHGFVKIFPARKQLPQPPFHFPPSAS